MYKWQLPARLCRFQPEGGDVQQVYSPTTVEEEAAKNIQRF